MSRFLVAFITALCLAPIARAEPAARLITVKILVADFDKTADFYRTVLGMQDTFHNPALKGRKDGAELGLNFGATADEAKANTGPTLVLVTSAAVKAHAAGKHAVAPIVLAVPDIDAVAKKVTDFGAPIVEPKKPLPPPYCGFVFLASDPSGNAVEFIQLPK